jgi:hypothetical protein
VSELKNDIRIYDGPGPDGKPTPAGEPLLSTFLNDVGKRLHAYFETYIKEDLKEHGPRPADLWGMFRMQDTVLYIYVARIGFLWWVRKLVASLDDADLRNPLGQSGLVFASGRPEPGKRSILVIDGVHRSSDTVAGVERACSCLRHHLGLQSGQGACAILWQGIPPPGAPAP